MAKSRSRKTVVPKSKKSKKVVRKTRVSKKAKKSSSKKRKLTKKKMKGGDDDLITNERALQTQFSKEFNINPLDLDYGETQIGEIRTQLDNFTNNKENKKTIKQLKKNYPNDMALLNINLFTKQLEKREKLNNLLNKYEDDDECKRKIVDDAASQNPPIDIGEEKFNKICKKKFDDTVELAIENENEKLSDRKVTRAIRPTSETHHFGPSGQQYRHAELLAKQAVARPRMTLPQKEIKITDPRGHYAEAL